MSSSLLRTLAVLTCLAAGPALAHQLGARGWRTTVVERAPQLRDEG